MRAMSAGSSDSEDELPDVQLCERHSSAGGDALRAMPSALEVAAEREREARAEEALRRLREQDGCEEGAGGGGGVRQDSSGSEGEAASAALAAAVRALRVCGAPPAPPPPPLLPAVAARAPDLPAATLRALARLQLRPAHPAFDLALRQISEALSVAEGEDSVWAVCALAALCGERAGGAVGGTLHALHALLARAPLAVASAAADELERAADALGPYAGAVLLRVSDASLGASEGARLLAGRLQCAAAARALRLPHAVAARPERVIAAAAGAPPGAQLAALRCAGRLLAQCGAPGPLHGPELLAALAPFTRRKDAHPDALKVGVAASKLRLLFVPHDVTAPP